MITMDLRLAQYQGYQGQGMVNFAYAQTGQGIFFTGTQIVLNSSTARCATAVVNAIVNDAHIRWQDYEFFDVQTHQGYLGHEDWCAINQLVIHGNERLITRVSFKTVVAPTINARKNEKVAAAIPEEIREAFLERIGQAE